MGDKHKQQDAVVPVHAGAAAYAGKSDDYFAGARDDFVSELPDNPHARILEIGCASGNTGALALSQGKCGWYVGVELDESAAQRARAKLSEVIVADVERMELPWPEQSFDALIMSEVLEHCADPWRVLKRLRPLLKPGALFFCSSPNVSHYRLIGMLLKGEWRLEDSGIMDRTHLRWFTPKTYGELVESAGFVLDYVGPIKPFGTWGRIRIALTGGRYHLFIKQIKIKAHCPS
jgi:2-polyprenyl-3-methyl-5-hydroxy-6-metoxy-1,4-benzoquinol methylase